MIDWKTKIIVLQKDQRTCNFDKIIRLDKQSSKWHDKANANTTYKEKNVVFSRLNPNVCAVNLSNKVNTSTIQEYSNSCKGSNKHEIYWVFPGTGNDQTSLPYFKVITCRTTENTISCFSAIQLFSNVP